VIAFNNSINIIIKYGIVFIVLFLFFGALRINSSRHEHIIDVKDSNVYALKYKLLTIRRAINDFRNDTGSYPVTLYDLSVIRKDKLVTCIKHDHFNGPYIDDEHGIPGFLSNPFIYTNDKEIAHHWNYNPNTGEIRSAIHGITANGIELLPRHR
jgi:hypothetical protein